MSDPTADNDSREALDSEDPKSKPARKAKLSLIMILVAFFSSLVCMCLAVFALVAI